MKNFTKKFLNRVEGKATISDEFHAATNNTTLAGAELKEIPKAWIKINFKTYPRLKKIILDKIDMSKTPLGKILFRRRSVRQFSGADISKQELEYLLYASSGIVELKDSFDESKRPYPSAGARYPLEIYPIILKAKGINKGLYHYNVKENYLEVLLEKDLTDWVVKNTGDQSWIKESSVVLVITAVLDRTRIKYDERGYRYALIEAGHLGQNISLLATELGLGSCALGGYIDLEVDKLLDIILQKENTLYLIAVGKQ
jgi:SagB-type dehydrogenase family enzyme